MIGQRVQVGLNRIKAKIAKGGKFEGWGDPCGAASVALVRLLRCWKGPRNCWPPAKGIGHLVPR